MSTKIDLQERKAYHMYRCIGFWHKIATRPLILCMCYEIVGSKFRKKKRNKNNKCQNYTQTQSHTFAFENGMRTYKQNKCKAASATTTYSVFWPRL